MCRLKKKIPHNWQLVVYPPRIENYTRTLQERSFNWNKLRASKKLNSIEWP